MDRGRLHQEVHEVVDIDHEDDVQKSDDRGCNVAERNRGYRRYLRGIEN